MNYKIITTTEFFDSLYDLKEYYSTFLYWSFLENFNDFIFTNIASLSFLPKRCKLFNILEWVYIFVIEWKYKIYYKINENKKEVYILKISLSSQNDINFF